MDKENDLKCAKTLVTVAVNSPVGDIELSACDNGLHRLVRPQRSSLAFNLQTKVQLKDIPVQSRNKWINQTIGWLIAYFESLHRLGSVEEPPICPTLLRSEFNGKVYKTLMNGTKFGQTISYSELATKAVGKPMASRAVGAAMKRNPILLIIPCHRVIKKDGSTGQFSGGIGVKEWLLSHEQNFTDN